MKLIKSMGVIGGLIVMAACGNNASNASADSTATVSADTSKKAPDNKAEQNFINYAVPGNTKEIVWLKAGISQGHNKQLKEHAKMMLKDHLKLDSTVSAYLGNHKDLSIPSVDTTNAVNINDKKGADWDKAWVQKMVDDHSELLTKLQLSSSDVKDTELLSIINGTIPVVQSHLSMVKDMQGKLK
jgi:putative membrane protein